MNIFDLVLVQPILNLLVAIYQGLIFLKLPGALGFAIIVLVVIVRAISWPLTSTQLKSAAKMAELRPRLDEIKKRFGHDRTKHQEEQMRLYRSAGVNPAAGCLPLILQMPIFIGLYNVLIRVVEAATNLDKLDGLNRLLYWPALAVSGLDPTFLGVNLGLKPAAWATAGAVLLAVPVITTALQFVQSKMMVTASPPRVAVAKEKKDELAETMQAVQSQMTYLMPAMIGFFSYTFPVGLSLYWNVFTVVGIIQQYQVFGKQSLKNLTPKFLWMKLKL